eukprot:Sdes_comp14924_c0_seq1m3616
MVASKWTVAPKDRRCLQEQLSPAFYRSLQLNDVPALRNLLLQGFNPHHDIRLPQTPPLHPVNVAVHFQSHQSLELLIALNCNLNSPDPDGITPTCQAIIHRDFRSLKLLLHSLSPPPNLPPALRDPSFHRPVYVAASQGSLLALQILLSFGYHADLPNSKGKTPAFYAVANGHFEALQLLVSYRINVHRLDCSGRSMLHMAARYSQEQCLKYLAALGVSPNGRDANGFTPLHETVSRGNVTCAALLLELGGVDVEARDARGRTALSICAETGNAECVLLLLKHGADVNSADDFQRTPAHFAAKSANMHCLEILIDCGSNLTKISSCGKTPIQEAIECNRHVGIPFLACLPPRVPPLKILARHAVRRFSYISICFTHSAYQALPPELGAFVFSHSHS